MIKNDLNFDEPQFDSSKLEDAVSIETLGDKIVHASGIDSGEEENSNPSASTAVSPSIDDLKGEKDWKKWIVSGVLGSPRWDEFLLAYVVERNGIRKILTEEEITRILHACEAQGCKNISRRKFEQFLKLVAKDNPCDRAKEMLANLPPWDGKQRVGYLLPNYLGTKTGPYEESVGYYWLTAMVARTLIPGCKADFIPILVGKSRTCLADFLRHMVPSEDLWTEACLADPLRLLTQNVIGRILVVWNDLGGIKGKADIDRIISFIKRPVIELSSRDYRGMDRYDRRFILVGTSVTKNFLRDADGYGLYLPFEVGKIDLELLKKDILQLWAEALHLVRQRLAAGLPPVQFGVVERLVQCEYYKFMYNGSTIQKTQFGNDIDFPKKIAALGEKFSTVQALQAVGLGFDLGKQNRNLMSDYLRRNGFVYLPRLIYGTRRKVWCYS